MQATIKGASPARLMPPAPFALTVQAAESHTTPGHVLIQIESMGELAGIEIPPHVAALLAGEIERAAWRAQEQAERLSVYVQKYEAKAEA